MYSVNITVRNTDNTAGREFEQAAAQFVEELKNVSGLDVQAPTQSVAHSKGEMQLLNDIVAYGVQIGAFSAIYLLAKDLYARCFRAEVVLNFPSGSSMTLKNLTQQEAEQAIEKYLKQQTPSPIIAAKG